MMIEETAWRSVEDFLADELVITAEAQMVEARTKEKDYEHWRFGQDLLVDKQLAELYFMTEWNDFYWDLYNAIGHAWKEDTDYINVWKVVGDPSDLDLYAENDAQRLLFWCIANEYTMDELKEMIKTKTIIQKR